MSGLRDVGFGVDDFQNPKMLSLADSIGQQLINLLLMERGTLPSMPHLGIGIRKYMSYSLEGELDEEFLKSQISSQAKELLPYLDMDGIVLKSFELEGSNVIYLAIPISIADATLLMAFSQKEDNSSILYDFKIEANKFIQ